MVERTASFLSFMLQYSGACFAQRPQPNKEEFSRTTRQLLSWGADVNLKALEEVYFQTKVFDESQYNAMLRLLSTFAEHLATISNSIEP